MSLAVIPALVPSATGAVLAFASGETRTLGREQARTLFRSGDVLVPHAIFVAGRQTSSYADGAIGSAGVAASLLREVRRTVRPIALRRGRHLRVGCARVPRCAEDGTDGSRYRHRQDARLSRAGQPVGGEERAGP